MSYVNAVLRAVFDGILFPFRDLPPLVGLAVVSLVAAVGMLFVFKATSNQKRLAEVKRSIHACLFEIRLFNDDLRAILRAQLEILRRNLTYLRLSSVPMLWMIPPLVLVIAQLQFHYGYRGLEPGKPALVEVTLADDWQLGFPDRPARPPLMLEAPEGVRVLPPSVWVPALNEMTWKVVAERAGDYRLRVRLGDREVTKSLRSSGAVVRRSPIRPDAAFWKQLIYPAEPPLPDDVAVESIRLTYPEADVSVFGWGVHWMVVFFVLSIVFAFALRNRLGVTI